MKAASAVAPRARPLVLALGRGDLDAFLRCLARLRLLFADPAFRVSLVAPSPLLTMASDSAFRPDVLAGRVALVTGGTSGIGFEIARQLGAHPPRRNAHARSSKGLLDTDRERNASKRRKGEERGGEERRGEGRGKRDPGKALSGEREVVGEGGEASEPARCLAAPSRRSAICPLAAGRRASSIEHRASMQRSHSSTLRCVLRVPPYSSLYGRFPLPPCFSPLR